MHSSSVPSPLVCSHGLIFNALTKLPTICPTQLLLVHEAYYSARCQVRLLNYFQQRPQYSNIANFDLNYDLSDSEIEATKEEDTSTDFFD